MKSFLEFYSQINEVGMGTIKTTCMRCGKKQATSQYIWNSGKARCKTCGGGLDVVQKIENNEQQELMNKIAILEKDPETSLGEKISDELNVLNYAPEKVYSQYGIDEKRAQELMDKAVLLFTYKN